MLAIETDDLSRQFPMGMALDGVRLRIRAGSVFGYLGPNGAGKTTTLHLLLGILAPTRGTAHVAGIDVAKQPDQVRRRCGALLEHNGLYERLSARENLEYHGRLWGLAPAERAQRGRELLEGMQLWERRDERVGTWSRGMKQRLAIGRALMHRPDVLFLDEPTAGFDPAAAMHLREDIRNLVREHGTTVFLTTHNLQEAQALCDEVGVLRAGRLLATGPPDALQKGTGPAIEVQGAKLAKTLPRLRRLPAVRSAEMVDGLLRVGLTNASDAPAVVRELVAAGADVAQVVKVRQDLETAFLAILEGQ